MEEINEQVAPTLNVDTELFYQLVLFNNRTVSDFYHVLFLRLLSEQRVT